jgi:anaerobic selenocysteine-containing dehydrogenase/Fe-S-cluster-containing dehydrogenase component
MDDAISRRAFLKISAAAGLGAAVDGCKPAPPQLIPYVSPEPGEIPGKPVFFRTACHECDSGCGVVARVREGRAIKLEGNPDHPINAGALCARGQAALQGVYNPDRLAAPLIRDGKGSAAPLNWEKALDRLARQCRAAADKGTGRVMFIGRPLGPTQAKIAQVFISSFNSNRLVWDEPLHAHAARIAARQCFGTTSLPSYRIDKTEALISFGADFLETWRSPVEFARQYADFRNPHLHEGRRIGFALYVGPRMSLTAAKTDKFISCPPASEVLVAMAILHAMVQQGGLKQPGQFAQLADVLAPYTPEAIGGHTGIDAQLIRSVAKAFAGAKTALAIAGTDDPALHVAAHLLNAASGNLGTTEFFTQGDAAPIATAPRDFMASVEAMRNGAIDVVIVSGANPLYTASSQLDFAGALRKVPFVVWCGGVTDETSLAAHLLLPIHHPLEEWTDAAPRPGVHVLGQPVMAPVFDSRSIGSILLETVRRGGHSSPWPDSAAAIRQEWEQMSAPSEAPGTAEEFWTTARHRGGLFRTPAIAQVQFNPAVLQRLANLTPAQASMTLVAYPHPFFYDGRGADKPWLQENPEPITQIVWDGWAELHSRTAKQLGVRNDEVIEINSQLGKIELPVRISDGIHPNAIAAPLGQGHTAYGRYAGGRGANVWPILPLGKLSIQITARATGKKHTLVSPVFTDNMMDRPIVESISVDDLRQGVMPPEKEAPIPIPYELWPKREYPRHNWGMTIDVNACTGCGACVTACYAENNITIVGKDQVSKGRIMSWLRLERYFPRRVDAPQILIEPMLCQQCDHAPCEPVCPVYASYHTDEGLNAQIYNRCVGTRYCENNCPYKVRRFNWLRSQWDYPLNMQLNPDVTVRGAGVMEKCTFCVQRIRAAEITAKIEERPVRDGEIVPACAQTCPARAITFGDIKDPNSAMMRRRRENAIRTYRALDELNTQPSITYLRTIYRSFA